MEETIRFWLGLQRLGLHLGGVLPYCAWNDVTQHLFNCNNFATSSALAEVCYLLSANLVS